MLHAARFTSLLLLLVVTVGPVLSTKLNESRLSLTTRILLCAKEAT